MRKKPQYIRVLRSRLQAYDRSITDALDRKEKAEENLDSAERRYHECFNNLKMVEQHLRNRNAKVAFLEDRMFEITRWLANPATAELKKEETRSPEDTTNLK
jgi:hypothetical protein